MDNFLQLQFSLKNPAIQRHLEKTLQEYEELTTRLLEPNMVQDSERMGLGKIHWKLTPLAECCKKYEKMKEEINELDELLKSK